MYYEVVTVLETIPDSAMVLLQLKISLLTVEYTIRRSHEKGL